MNLCKNLKKYASVQTRINKNPKNNENKVNFFGESCMHKYISQTK